MQLEPSGNVQSEQFEGYPIVPNSEGENCSEFFIDEVQEQFKKEKANDYRKNGK